MSNRVLRGSVVRVSKDLKTIYVLIQTSMKHNLYDRIIKKSRIFPCHNPYNNVLNIGSSVDILESRPISKNKCFIVLNSVV
jgi:small subunit ribosomal protein S17